MADGRARRARAPARVSSRRGVTARRLHAPTSSSRAARRSRSPASRSSRSRVPGHSPGHLAYYADGCLFSGDVLFAGSVGRTDLPGADWDTLLASIRTLVDRFPPETVVYSGHGPPTTLGDELARNPFLAELRVRDDASRRRAARTTSSRPTSRSGSSVTGEAERSARSTATGRIQTPVFEDTALFARTSGAGSDVVQKEMYTFEDRGGRSLTLRPEGTAPIVPRVPRARHAPRAAAGEALHDRADVPLRGAAARPLPRALAALGRGDRLGRPGDRRRGDPALRRAARAARRDATTSSSSTRSATRTAGRRTSSG